MKTALTHNGSKPQAHLSKRHRGVTSIQVLFAALIGGLTASSVASLVVGAGQRPQAERTEAVNRVRNITLGTMMYAMDSDDSYPYVQSTKSAKSILAPYVQGAKMFDSPTQGGEFRFNLNLGGVLSTSVKKPAEAPLWVENLPGDQDPAVGYADGNKADAKIVDAAGRKELERQLKVHFHREPNSKPLPKDYLGGLAH